MASSRQSSIEHTFRSGRRIHILDPLQTVVANQPLAPDTHPSLGPWMIIRAQCWISTSTLPIYARWTPLPSEIACPHWRHRSRAVEPVGGASSPSRPRVDAVMQRV